MDSNEENIDMVAEATKELTPSLSLHLSLYALKISLESSPDHRYSPKKQREVVEEALKLWSTYTENDVNQKKEIAIRNIEEDPQLTPQETKIGKTKAEQYFGNLIYGIDELKQMMRFLINQHYTDDDDKF